MNPRTRHLLFLDESGTHDMAKIDARWPIFVLVGLLVGESYYAKTLTPRIRALKRSHGLPTNTVLHSRDIRRWEGSFAFLRDQPAREEFYAALNNLFANARIRLFAVIIDKARLAERWMFPPSPYDVSLSQLLSLVCGPPGIPTPWRPNVVRISAERRGKVEDRDLQSEYQRFRSSGLPSYGAWAVQSRRSTTVARVFPARIDFLPKTRAVGGLELADLAAYPIGRAFVNRDWDHPSYAALDPKIRAWISFP